jgi:hypothetical protein
MEVTGSAQIDVVAKEDRTATAARHGRNDPKRDGKRQLSGKKQSGPEL